MALTTNFLDKIVSDFVSKIQKGQYELEGVWNDISIFQTNVDNQNITIYVNLDDTISGTLTGFRLIDTDDEIADEIIETVEKPSTKALLKAFRYQIQEV